MSLRIYVERLSDQERHEIMESYEKFARDGSIGDEAVRRHTVAYMRATGLTPDAHVVLFMREIAFECFRHEALQLTALVNAARMYTLSPDFTPEECAQILLALNEKKDAELERLRAENVELQMRLARMADLESRLSALEVRANSLAREASPYWRR